MNRELRWHVLTIVVAAAIAGGFFAALVLSGGSPPSLEGRSYHLQLLAPSAVSVVPGSEVRVAGLQVGSVDDVERRGRRALIKVAIDDDQAPLPRDTRFDIRLRTIIGETYVELLPGDDPSGLPDAAVLAATREAHEYVEVEQILDVLKGRTRSRARRMISGLGAGLSDHGDELNAVLARSAGVVDRLAPVSAVLSRDRAQVARFVEQFGDVARALADRGSAIRLLARRERDAATAMASEDAALRATIAALPATLAQVRETSQTTGRAAVVAAPVVRDVAGLIDDLHPSVRLLEPAARSADALVSELGVASPVLRRTLGRVRTLAPPAERALPQVRRALCQVNPTVDYLAPYAREAIALLQNLASASAYYDADGHAVRVHALMGDTNFAGTPAGATDAMQLLLESGLIGEAHSLGYEPYAAPGDISPPSTGSGVAGPRHYEGGYRRVRAAC